VNLQNIKGEKLKYVVTVREETNTCRLLAAAALREFYTLSPGIRRFVYDVLKEKTKKTQI